jgi:hypothetical protein
MPLARECHWTDDLARQGLPANAMDQDTTIISLAVSRKNTQNLNKIMAGYFERPPE